MRVNGGAGIEQGHGGAGGRVAVKAAWNFDFPGKDHSLYQNL